MDPVATRPSSLARPARAIGGALIAAALTVSLVGCSALGDVVGQQVGSAACTVGSGVIKQIASDVATAAADVSVDPAAALASLQTAEAALAVAAVSFTEEPAASAIVSAQAALVELTTMATDASNGVAIDEQALAAATENFAKQLSGVC